MLSAISQAVVRVSDSGLGLPVNLTERALEPFTRSAMAGDRRTRTTGLGLAIAHAIVRAHSGRIGIAISSGGVVEFALPVEFPTGSPVHRRL
jgi:two-component system OmpR family sensor kinase